MILGVRQSFKGRRRIDIPLPFRRGRTRFAHIFHLPPSAILNAETGAFLINPTTASFGSYAPATAQARSFVQNTKGQYLSGGLTITLDVMEGAAEVQDFDVPFDFTRVAVVEGLNASATDTTAGLFQEALLAVAGLVGGLGAIVIDISYPTYLARFTPELLSATAVKVKITYRSYPLPQYEFDTCINQIQTNVTWKSKTPILVYYTYPDSHTLPDGSTFWFDERLLGTEQTQNALVPLPLYESIVTVKFTVTAGSAPSLTIEGKTVPVSGSATNIVTALKMLEGHVADAAASIGNLYGGARCWLFERVNARSRNAGITYEVVMSVHLRKIGWDPTATFIDKESGLPPPDANPNNTDNQWQAPVIPDCVWPSWLFANLGTWSGSPP